MVFQGSSAAISHTGKVRSNNQDSGYCGSNLFVVADGMGGHAGGDVASSLAISRLERIDRPFESTSAAERALRDAIADAAIELIDTVQVRPELAGMGTTVSALVMVDEYAVIAHIGDSRIYLYRDGALTQITTDHTFVQRLVDSGRITPEEARYHPRRSVLMRVLGDMDPDPELDTFIMPTQPGDRWLLCSDGLSGVVDDPHTAKALGLGLAPGRTADNLLKQALDGGAPDNVTLVLVDVGGQHPTFSGTPTIVGSASNPMGIEVPAARPGRTSWLHPNRQAANEPTHFEPAAEFLEELIEEDRRRVRRRRVGWTVGLVLVLGLIAAALYGGYQWTQTRFFVGGDEDTVVIFRGIQQDIGPIPLSTAYEDTGIPLDSLSDFARATVEQTISARSIDDARRIVTSISETSGGWRMSAASPAAASDTVAADTAVVRALRRIRVPQTQRNRELFLLIFAFAINAGAIALVQLGALDAIDWTFLVYCGGLTALVLALHIVLRLRARAADPFVVPIATLLTGLGLAMIYRIDLARDDHSWEAASTRQLAWTAIAVVGAIAVVMLLRNYRVLFRYTYVSGLAGVVLLILPIIPGLGTDANADVWVSLGFFSFQPGEIAKILLAIFFAGYLVRTRESLTSVGTRFLGLTWPRARELGPLLVIWLISLAIIVVQRDLGTGLLIFGMFVAMLYVATGKTSWVLIGVVLAAAGAYLASRVLPYVGGRFANWLDAFNPAIIERSGGSYQLVQGIFGLAQGGLIGTGLGQGRPYITPLSQSDYILPSLGEELGLIGVFAILSLYMVFASRGIRIGLAGQDDFGKLLATGLSFTIALQVFIMVGGVTRVIPLTGLTTPFLAAGGSSLVANWIIVALLLRISDAVRSRPRVVIG